MNRHDIPLVVHVGYPKTATTTFQLHVFPRHPEIEYLGKFIPSFRYADDKLYGLIDELLHSSTVRFRGVTELRSRINDARARTSRACTLISSESFIHPSVVDIATVADRLHAAFHPCKILITIREQISAILSFYWMHGRYGQYLTIGSKDEADRIRYPMPFSDWACFQKSAEHRNYLGTLHYHAVVGYYIEKFGADNVRVLLFESIKEEMDGYARDLGAFLGVDAAMLRNLMNGRHEHRSEGRSTPWEAGQADAVNVESRIPRFLETMRYCFRKRAIHTSASAIETEIAELREAYRAGNARLARDLRLPLDQFGYAV